MFKRNFKPTPDKLMTDHIGDILVAALGTRVGRIDREKGTIRVLSISTDVVYRVTVERVT